MEYYFLNVIQPKEITSHGIADKFVNKEIKNQELRGAIMKLSLFQ